MTLKPVDCGYEEKSEKDFNDDRWNGKWIVTSQVRHPERSEGSSDFGLNKVNLRSLTAFRVTCLQFD
jgi:hypothetical protein